MDTITSLTNPRIKDVVRLQKSGSHRRERGLFCIESQRELGRALRCGFECVEFFQYQNHDAPPGSQVYDITEPVLNKIAYRQNPQGFVAVMKSGAGSSGSLRSLDQLPDTGLFVVCSGLEKPGNIGAIMRSADAVGVSGVMIDSPEFDLFNPNAIRASTGGVFSVPTVCDSPEVIRRWLRHRGIRIVAATPDADTDYTQADLADQTALVLGAEAEGLDDSWRAAADVCVSIPMTGMVDSLNVSATAAVMLFEAARQQRTRS